MRTRQPMAAMAVVVGLAMIASLAMAGLNTKFETKDWDVELVYEYNSDDTEIVNYDVVGTYDKLIDCHGNWKLIADETLSTTQDTREITYGIDYSLGELGSEHVYNGEVTSKILACDADFTVEFYYQGKWHEWSASLGETGSILQNETDEYTAPIEAPSHHARLNVSQDAIGGNWTLRVAANQAAETETDPHPFTGQLYEGVVWDGDINRVFRGKSCSSVGGVCWPGGQDGKVWPVASSWNATDTSEDWQINWKRSGPFHKKLAAAGNTSHTLLTYD